MTYRNNHRIKSLYDSITRYSREELEDYYVLLLMDTSEDDTAIRKLCEKALTQDEIDGNSYCVPSIVDLVEMLVNKYENIKANWKNNPF